MSSQGNDNELALLPSKQQEEILERLHRIESKLDAPPWLEPRGEEGQEGRVVLIGNGAATEDNLLSAIQRIDFKLDQWMKPD